MVLFGLLLVLSTTMMILFARDIVTEIQERGVRPYDLLYLFSVATWLIINVVFAIEIAMALRLR